MRRLLLLALAALLALPVVQALPARAEQEVDEPLYIPAMLIREGNFRADPSTKNPPIGTFPAGTQVLILGSVQDSQQRPWYLIRLYDTGQEGWMFGNLLRALPQFPNPPSGMGITEVKDPAERDLLVGGHGLTLQWIGVKQQGELVAFEDLGLVYIDGAQDGTGQAQGDWIEVKGYVTLIDTNRFVLSGSVEYHVASLTGQGNCRSTGSFVFERAAKKKNWRLQTTASPCGKWDQFVDVYVRDEK